MLVIFALLLVVLLGFAGVAIDIGRQNAERRHIQTAADAAALAACRALIDGDSDRPPPPTEARTVARHQHRALALGHDRPHRAGCSPEATRTATPATRPTCASGIIVERHHGAGRHRLDR